MPLQSKPHFKPIIKQLRRRTAADLFKLLLQRELPGLLASSEELQPHMTATCPLYHTHNLTSSWPGQLVDVIGGGGWSSFRRDLYTHKELTGCAEAYGHACFFMYKCMCVCFSFLTGPACWVNHVWPPKGADDVFVWQPDDRWQADVRGKHTVRHHEEGSGESVAFGPCAALLHWDVCSAFKNESIRSIFSIALWCHLQSQNCRFLPDWMIISQRVVHWIKRSFLFNFDFKTGNYGRTPKEHLK